MRVFLVPWIDDESRNVVLRLFRTSRGMLREQMQQIETYRIQLLPRPIVLL